MIVCSGTKSLFHGDVISNDIGNIIHNVFKGATGHGTRRSEIDAWSNSLRFMHDVPLDMAIKLASAIFHKDEFTTLLKTVLNLHEHGEELLKGFRKSQGQK